MNNAVEELIVSSFLGLSMLIFPSLIFGLLWKNTINIYIYVYFGISMLWGVYLMWKRFYDMLEFLLNHLNKFDINTLNELEFETKGLLTIINTIVIIEYIIIVLLGPVKGWDALHFYIPHGYVIYLLNYIPTINPLNFIPMFKPPLVPLLVAFTYYTTKDANVYWIPLFFFLLEIMLIDQITFELHFSEIMRKLSTAFFLFTPLTYFLFFDWPYYQDLPVMVMISGIIWVLLKTQKKGVLNEKFLSFSILMLLLGLSPLTKLSGYVFYFLYALFIPGPKWWKHMKSVIILLAGIASAYRSIHNISVWTGVVILCFTISMIIILEKNDVEQGLKQTLMYLTPLILGLLPGIAWAYQILVRVPEGRNVIRALFLDTNSTIQWGYTGSSIAIYTVTAEHAFMASWATSVFAIFLAALFSPIWLLPKLIGFIKIKKERQTWLLLWLFGFYIVWLGNFSTVSIRYLTPILPPLSIITARGFLIIYRYYRRKLVTKGILRGSLLLTLVFAYGSMYPTYPFEFVRLPDHVRLYLFHYEWYRTLLYVFLITSVLVLLGYVDLLAGFKSHRKSLVGLKRFTFAIGMILIVTMPLGPQGFVLYQYDYDLDRARGRWAIHTRPEVQELANAIIKYVPKDEVILVENLPGLEWFSLHSVLDYYSFRTVNLPSGWENTSYAHEVMFDHNIKWVVTKSSYSLYYDEYVHSFYKQFIPFFFASNSLYGKAVYENQEFWLYEIPAPMIRPIPRVLSISFGGVYHQALTGEKVMYEEPQDKKVYVTYEYSSDPSKLVNLLIKINGTSINGTSITKQLTITSIKGLRDSVPVFSINTAVVLYGIEVTFYLSDQSITYQVRPLEGNAMMITPNGITNDSLIIT